MKEVRADNATIGKKYTLKEPTTYKPDFDSTKEFWCVDNGDLNGSKVFANDKSLKWDNTINQRVDYLFSKDILIEA